VTAADLAFTESEIADLAELSASDAAGIHARTGGWAAGVALLVSETTGAALDDYIEDVLLAGMSPVVRRFVEETAVLERPTAASADRLLGGESAASHYEAVDRLGRFPHVVGSSAERWQPPIVRDYLLACLEARDPERFAHLSNIAAGLEGAAVALSARELEVLALLDRGLTIDDIGRELSISFHTAKAHVRSVYEKLDVSKRVGALQRARELGLLGS
jgi:ATP/maltotriose-dependent transcriptional regulator MalT